MSSRHPSPPLAPVDNRPGEFLFWCPGCECAHFVRTAEYYRQHGGRGPAWTVSGPEDAPTVRASVLVNRGGANPEAPVCHLFITDGKIRYLGDCTHALAGRTVPLRWPTGEDDE